MKQLHLLHYLSLLKSLVSNQTDTVHNYNSHNVIYALIYT